MALTLDHLEKMFGDLYRKEIDQEENVWRTLPFFAAAIALQFGIVSGLLPKALEAQVPLGADIRGALILILILDGLTLAALALSIASREYHYLPSEPQLLLYASSLDAAEAEAATLAQPGGFDAQEKLKRYLAESYSEATSHNRRINQSSVAYRRIAGLLILASMLATLFLFGRIVLHLSS